MTHFIEKVLMAEQAQDTHSNIDTYRNYRSMSLKNSADNSCHGDKCDSKSTDMLFMYFSLF